MLLRISGKLSEGGILSLFEAPDGGLACYSLNIRVNVKLAYRKSKVCYALNYLPVCSNLPT